MVGNVPYLGFFDVNEARDFADELRVEGYDADVRGAAAYSSLGWSTIDPILSTMLGGGDEGVGGLANVVLHESVHATFYVPGQSPLNESVAEFLGDRFAVAYLGETFGEHSNALRAYLDGARERDRHAAAFHAAHVALAKLYASPKRREQNLAETATILRRLRAETEFSAPDHERDAFGLRGLQRRPKPELDELYEACDRKTSRVLASLRELGPASFSKPHEQDLSRVLAPLVRRAHAARLARRGGVAPPSPPAVENTSRTTRTAREARKFASFARRGLRLGRRAALAADRRRGASHPRPRDGARVAARDGPTGRQASMRSRNRNRNEQGDRDGHAKETQHHRHHG